MSEATATVLRRRWCHFGPLRVNDDLALAFPQHPELDAFVTGLGAHFRNLRKPPVDAARMVEHGARQSTLDMKSLHSVHFNRDSPLGLRGLAE